MERCRPGAPAGARGGPADAREAKRGALADLCGDRECDHQLHRRIERQLLNAERGAGVSPALSQRIDEQLRGPIQNLGLVGKPPRGRDVTLDPQEPSERPPSVGPTIDLRNTFRAPSPAASMALIGASMDPTGPLTYSA